MGEDKECGKIEPRPGGEGQFAKSQVWTCNRVAVKQVGTAGASLELLGVP